MEIAKKRKELRKSRGMTQEQLAGRLGISFQAVSKWENDIALPDITTIPALADLFGVSTDELFDYKRERIREEIEEICGTAYPLREKDPAAARRILENGLEKYPGNERLTDHLLYVMNCRENPDEMIETAERLTVEAENAEIRYDALRFLAYAYKEKGDQKAAENAIEQIPKLYFTKLSEAAFILEGAEKHRAASKQKWISLEMAMQMFIKEAECLWEEGDRKAAAAEADRALRIMEILKDEKQAEKLDIYEEYLRNRYESSGE